MSALFLVVSSVGLDSEKNFLKYIRTLKESENIANFLRSWVSFSDIQENTSLIAVHQVQVQVQVEVQVQVHQVHQVHQAVQHVPVHQGSP